ncbi:MAG: hypothetical protein BWZ07_02938 [Alphaproteobacteria bacterium ADurb.BinA280]|nr:MAG: hypothetical protein BWZ07_02938 [Alphaproteobacteria bacterium ADurb.BinA280]
MGKPCVATLEIRAVNGLHDSAGWAARWWRQLANAQTPGGQGTAIGACRVVTQIQCPSAARIFAIKGSQAIGTRCAGCAPCAVVFGAHLNTAQNGESGRATGFVIQHQIHLGLTAGGRRTNVSKQPIVIARRRTQMRVNVPHQGMVE